MEGVQPEACRQGQRPAVAGGTQCHSRCCSALPAWGGEMLRDRDVRWSSSSRHGSWLRGSRQSPPWASGFPLRLPAVLRTPSRPHQGPRLSSGNPFTGLSATLALSPSSSALWPHRALLDGGQRGAGGAEQFSGLG